MPTIRELVENKTQLHYPVLCTALIEQFGVSETVNWYGVLPAAPTKGTFWRKGVKVGGNPPPACRTEGHQAKSFEKGKPVTNAVLFC